MAPEVRHCEEGGSSWAFEGWATKAGFRVPAGQQLAGEGSSWTSGATTGTEGQSQGSRCLRDNNRMGRVAETWLLKEQLGLGDKGRAWNAPGQQLIREDALGVYSIAVMCAAAGGRLLVPSRPGSSCCSIVLQAA